MQAFAATAASASARRPRTRTSCSVNQAQPKSTPTDSLGILPRIRREPGRRRPRGHLRIHGRHQTMEPLWSPVVATGGNQWQIRSARNPPKQAKSVATACDRLPEKFHGKQGVCRGLPPVAGGPLPAKEGVDLHDRRCATTSCCSPGTGTGRNRNLWMPCGSCATFYLRAVIRRRRRSRRMHGCGAPATPIRIRSERRSRAGR